MLFAITGEESCNSAGIKLIDCICECDWPVVGQLGGVFFFVKENGFTVFPLCWNFSLFITVVKK